MRTRTLVLALCLLATLGARPASAQGYVAAPVTVSTEKVKGGDGKLYWSHPVLERQTVYSIAKAYGVSAQDVFNANPGLAEKGLKSGSVILVPISEATAARTSATEVPRGGQAAAEAPAAQARQPLEKAQQQPEDIVHTVRWYEDIAQIARKYGVPEDVIIAYNGLTSRKLKTRQQLLIPGNYDPATGTVKNPAPPVEANADDGTAVAPADPSPEEPSKPAKTDDDEDEDGSGIFDFGRKTKAKVALLMPFGSNSSNPGVNYMDFYSGVLMGVRDLGKEGLDVELTVYDTKQTNFPVSASDLAQTDIVIGPTAVDGLKKVLDIAPSGCAVVSPLEPKAAALAATSANFIQAPSPAEDQLVDIAHWIKESYSAGDRVIIISDSEDSKDNLLDSLLTKEGIASSRYSFAVSSGRAILGPLTEMMTTEGNNHVVIRSEKEAFTFEAVRNLNLAKHNKRSVVLYAPSRIRSYSTIDVENLHSLNLHVSMSYFIDYDDPRTKDFLMTYRSLFGAEPTQFSFQGYDTSTYFVRSCLKNGRRWMRRITTSGPERMLQSTFDMARVQDGGIINKGIRRAVYTEDYRIQLVK